jgi:hypothetical protein
VAHESEAAADSVDVSIDRKDVSSHRKQQDTGGGFHTDAVERRERGYHLVIAQLAEAGEAIRTVLFPDRAESLLNSRSLLIRHSADPDGGFHQLYRGFRNTPPAAEFLPEIRIRAMAVAIGSVLR